MCVCASCACMCYILPPLLHKFLTLGRLSMQYPTC